jgi:transposase
MLQHAAGWDAFMASFRAAFPDALADRGYDSNRFRAALLERGITPCIPSTRSRKVEIPLDKTLYRQRHRIENMFGRLKDWRRVATRYDRSAHTFFSAILHRSRRNLLAYVVSPDASAPRDHAAHSRPVCAVSPGLREQERADQFRGHSQV